MPASPAELVLRRLNDGPAAAAELERLLGQSQSSVSRMLRDLVARREVIRFGARRGARYARLRTLEGIGSQWPLRQVDVEGNMRELGTLRALAGSSWQFDATARGFAWEGTTAGLPYFLQDQRPAGFLGRTAPQRFPELQLPQRVMDWSDDHYLRYLTQRGSDTVGDLILGDAALDVYLASLRRAPDVPAEERARRYPQLAADVMGGGYAGSSAHGEHPKFAVLLGGEGSPRHVLVKFSPPDTTPVGQRWSDLLVAEHLAQAALAAAGLPASTSRVWQFAGRTFLEVDRFDRAGAAGRVGVSSLLAIDTAFYGRLDNWIDAAGRLHRDRRIDAATLETVRLVSTFGALIANTDRHFGNLAFFDRYDGKFQLAPVYDMLPMLFAPEHDQLPERRFAPPDPTSETLRAYARARALAEGYWRTCSQDARISPDFQRICAAGAASLDALPRTGAFGG
ncbi:MAG: type II toxin-antitoxin system HipA family toxin YjjJ [Pseudomonadota bacterium]